MSPLDVASDFSALRRDIGGRKLIYLDAAASTPSPDLVLDREANARRSLFANIHRGQHALSEEATAAFEDARRRVARFICAEPRSIVFTRGTTESINLVARGLQLPPKALVLSTLSEHHSNLAPWLREGRVVFLDSDPRSIIEPDVLARALQQYRPSVFAFQHASNVTGVVQPAADLCRVSREHGVTTVIDAAQSAPHIPLDVGQLGCDFLAFSGHKLLGPKGVGVLFGRYEQLERLTALSVGGGAVQEVTTQGFLARPPPEGLEAGTPNLAGAVGLAAAIDYLQALGMDEVRSHGIALADQLRQNAGRLPQCRFLSGAESTSLPIVSLVPQGSAMTSNQLATLLSDSFGIMVRSGLQCAHPLFDALGANAGALRVSAYVFNVASDIDSFFESTAQLLHKFG